MVGWTSETLAMSVERVGSADPLVVELEVAAEILRVAPGRRRQPLVGHHVAVGATDGPDLELGSGRQGPGLEAAPQAGGPRSSRSSAVEARCMKRPVTWLGITLDAPPAEVTTPWA